MSFEELERCATCGASVDVYEVTCPACGAALKEAKLKAFHRLRDSGSLTADALVVIQRLLAEGADRGGVATGRGPRKQLTELTVEDLEECPVWEFTLDEEGEPGQDEETLKPRPEVTEVNAVEGVFVVSARFTAADGTVLHGYVTPSEMGNDLESPTVFSERGKKVQFAFGIVEPDSSALEAAYRALGKNPRELFPITVEALVPTGRGRVRSELRGFAYLDREGRTRLKS